MQPDCRTDLRQLMAISIFTPFQAMVAERIIHDFTPAKVIIFDQRSEGIRNQLPFPRDLGEVIELNVSGRAMDRSQQKLFADVLLDLEKRTAGNFTFVASSYEWSFNNAILRHFRKRSRFYAMEDGLSTYLNLRRSLRGLAREVAREVAVRARGFTPRYIVPGHPLGLSLQEMKGVFILSEWVGEAAHMPPSILLSKPSKSSRQRDFEEALVVGQPYMRDYGVAAMKQQAERMHRLLKSEGVKAIRFKPHHFQSADEIKVYLDTGMRLVETPLPLEAYFESDRAGVIAGINSTALITSKTLFGDEIRAMAVDPLSFKPPKERRCSREVLELFRRAGVEVSDRSASR